MRPLGSCKRQVHVAVSGENEKAGLGSEARELGNQIEAIAVREPNVSDDEADFRIHAEMLQRLALAARGERSKSFLFEAVAKHFEHVSSVFDHQKLFEKLHDF